ncbi:MAG: hypothetical protein AAGH60_03110 [Pseudomonadota bacterium]
MDKTKHPKPASRKRASSRRKAAPLQSKKVADASKNADASNAVEEKKAAQEKTTVSGDVVKKQALPPAPTQDDYDAIAAAVMETERGRWFLAEYARRNRHADTEKVLDALGSLQSRWDKAFETRKPDTKQADASNALLSRDVIDLAEAITQVKREVRELGGADSGSDHFNSATSELEAIVQQTETATSEILEAAEKVQEVLWTLREEGANATQCDIIESKIIEIYTSCSFQDLTGQRSNKVVRLVGYVERRVASMMAILGLTDDTVLSHGQAHPVSSDEAAREGDLRGDAHLLHGPQMAQSSNDQGDVDALFEFSAPDPKARSKAPLDHPQSPEPEPAAAAEEPGQETDQTADIAISHPDMPSEAPDVFSAEANEGGQDDTDQSEPQVIDDSAFVEIYEAEILGQASEQSLHESALPASTANQPFEVDTLDFEGPTLEGKVSNDPSDDRPPSLTAFEVSDNAADIFADVPEPTSPSAPIDRPPAFETEAAKAASALMAEELIAPPVFDPETIDLAVPAVETASDKDADETLVDLADEALYAATGSNDPEPPGQEAYPEDSLLDDLQLANEEAQFDEALAALEGDISQAIDALKVAEAEAMDAAPVDETTRRSSKTVKKGLLADYTDAERIALFS